MRFDRKVVKIKALSINDPELTTRSVLMNKSKIFCFLLVCAVLLTLAGCGSGAKPALNITVDQTPTDTVTRPPAAGVLTSGPESSAPSSSQDEESSSSSGPVIPPPIQLNTISVVVKGTATLYPQPRPENGSAFYGDGTRLEVEATDDPMWYKLTLDTPQETTDPDAPQNETAGTWYIYAEALSRTQGGKSLWQETLEDKFAELQEKLPDGKYWNHMYNDDIEYGTETPWLVTDTPCDNWEIGEYYCNSYTGATGNMYMFSGNTINQCLGFASLLSDQIFGTGADFHIFHDADLLRPGDHIRYDAYEHSVTVLGVYDDYITVGECNEDYVSCLIEWGRRITFDELEYLSWDITYISRYPMYMDDDGRFVPWED